MLLAIYWRLKANRASLPTGAALPLTRAYPRGWSYVLQKYFSLGDAYLCIAISPTASGSAQGLAPHFHHTLHIAVYMHCISPQSPQLFPQKEAALQRGLPVYPQSKALMHKIQPELSTGFSCGLCGQIPHAAPCVSAAHISRACITCKNTGSCVLYKLLFEIVL